MTNRRSSAPRSNREAVWSQHVSAAVGRPWIVGHGNAATDAEPDAVDELRRRLEEGLF
jgi:hypothetical protein